MAEVFCQHGLSSAAFVSLFIGGGAILFYHLKPYFRGISWWTMVGMMTVLAVAVHVVSDGGIFAVISRLTLNPDTALYRTLIWDFGTDSIAKHPWFGIGYNNWERLSWMTSDSVDAHFLLLGMRHGLVVPVVLLLGIVASMIRLGLLMPALDPAGRAIMLGVNITAAAYIVVGQTVNFFGSSALIFMSMVGLLGSMTQWADQHVKTEARKRIMIRRMMLQAQTA